MGHASKPVKISSLIILKHFFLPGDRRSGPGLHRVRRGHRQPAVPQPVVPHVLRHARLRRVVVASGRVHGRRGQFRRPRGQVVQGEACFRALRW